MSPAKSRRRSSKRRPVPHWLVALITFSVVFAAAYAYLRLGPLDGPIPNDAGTDYATLQKGYTAEGFPYLGRPNAPVLIEDFSSYSCPHCGDFHKDIFPDLLDKIAAGQVQFVFIPVPHIGAGSANAARALLCAGEQDKLWEMHDTLFYWQDKFLTRTFEERRIMDGAKNMGLDTTAFESCLDAYRTDLVVDAAKVEFRKRGLRGTPGFFINGVKVEDYDEFYALN